MSNHPCQLPEARNALPTADCVSSEQTKVFTHFIFAHSFPTKESARENCQAEIFKGRLGLPDGEIVRAVSPELARTEVAELVRTFLLLTLVKTFLLTLVIAGW